MRDAGVTQREAEYMMRHNEDVIKDIQLNRAIKTYIEKLKQIKQ